MSKLTIKLPCSPLVKRYLINTCGDMIIFRNKTAIEKHFALLVDKQPRKDECKKVNYTEHVIIWVDYDMHLRNGTLLTNCAIRDFNLFLEDIIYDQLISALNLHGKLTARKRYITEGIKIFCEMHNFSEDEMSYDAAIKRYQRSRGINTFSKPRQPR